MPRAPREAMIDSAVTLFRVRGVADTSLRDVVEHSGVSRGSIYHHFPGGKEELALAATERGGTFISGLLERLLDDDAEKAIAAFVDYWTSALTAAGFQDGCPVAAAALSSDETASARTAAGVAFGRWESLLAEAIARRGVPAARAASLATLAIAGIEGALLICRAQGSTEPLARVGAELRRLVAENVGGAA
ncbi:TetR/AcrR family transcriptional regulator [Alloactinosynnema sp. L-07]|uniref:TetR/AcrR family transcriptional regulator n=1 Tax=Alloactinosynnema sp. L-07 TaxID=1653480 RepID=UPI0006B44B7C|nr:TetR/AcrR family transcriptional regulator [Alloactinosynnema sp. L-07]